MKKSGMNALFIVYIIFTLSFTLYDLRSIEAPSNREIEGEDVKVLDNPNSLSNDSFDWIPIESTLTFDDNGDRQIVDAPCTTIAYDPINNLEILESNDVHAREFDRQVEEYEGLLDINHGLSDQDVLRTSYVFPPDDRQRVDPTTSFPWRTICKLFITAQDGSRYAGSGAIIDNFHVLTCGHCVYLHDDGGWADEIQIIPGKNSDEEPFGHAFVTYMRSYTEWTVSRMYEHDWAVLTLDRNIGAYTGWMGRQTADPSSSIYTGIVNTAGYPGDLDYGENMYFVGDSGDRADEYNHWYWIDSASGQSGSPVWRYDGSDRFILTVHAYGYQYGTDANFGTRLNGDKYDQINSWLNLDSSAPPNDKAELLEGDSYSSFSTTDVISGQTNFEIYCDVKNSGTATASSFRVNYVASEDSLITPSDYLLGSKDISDVQPFTTANADWSGVFSSNVPEGSYYIGLIIDSENTIDELDENNNYVIVSYTRIDVESPLPIIETILIVVGVVALVGVTSAIVLIARAKFKKRQDLEYREFSPEPYKERWESVFEYKSEAPKILPLKHPKFCTNCGTQTVKGAIFCINCGNDLRKVY